MKSREDHIPIIGLTAHVRKEDEKACYDAGMNGFLTKPIIKNKLAEVLSEMLSGKK
jgi:CheY-like chemotaxis protein